MNLFSQPNIESRLKVIALNYLCLTQHAFESQLGYRPATRILWRGSFRYSVHRNIGLFDMTAPHLIHEALHLWLPLLGLPKHSCSTPSLTASLLGTPQMCNSFIRKSQNLICFSSVDNRVYQAPRGYHSTTLTSFKGQRTLVWLVNISPFSFRVRET